VRYERKRAGLTQEQLADALGGRPRVTVSRIERAVHEPRVQTLSAIAIVLDVPLSALLIDVPAGGAQ